MRDYWSFLSYAHLDNRDEGRQWASWLHHQLETYEIPAELIGNRNDRGEEIPSRLFPCFRDEEELSAGGTLTQRIHEALDRSKTLVVLCSPRSSRSAYVDAEIAHFQESGKGDRIFIALIDGDPAARVGDLQSCIPERLWSGASGDVSGSAVDDAPLAADFRLPQGSEGWTTPEAYRQAMAAENGRTKREIHTLTQNYQERLELALLKVQSGVLGVPLGELQKRDKQFQLGLAKKRAKVLRRWLATVTVLLVSAIVAGSLAWMLKKEADRQTIIANHQQGEAEGLVAFLLEDLHDRLQPVGQVHMLESLTERSSDYLNRNPDVRSLTNRVSLHLRRGQIFKQLGRINEAVGEFEAALHVLGHTDEAGTDRLEAEIRARLGDVLTYVGRLREAKDQCLASLAILEQLPETPETIISEARANTYLADVMVRQSDRAGEAMRLLEKSVDALGRLDADDLGVHAPLLLDTLLKLGDARLRGQDSRGALRDYGDCNRRAEQLADTFRSDIRYVRWQAEADVRLANALSASGESNSATESVNRARDLLERLVAHDPLNVPWQTRNAVSLIALARLEGDLGSPRTALERTEEVLGKLRELAEFDPRNIEMRNRLANALTLQGELCYSPRFGKEPDLDGAESAMRKSLDIRLEIIKGGATGDLTPYREEYAKSQIHLARILGLRGRYDEALESLMAGEEELGSSETGEGAEEPFLLERAAIAETRGDLHNRFRKPGAAREAWTSAVGFKRKIVGKDPDNRSNRLDLASTLTKLGTAWLRSGQADQVDEAIGYLSESEEITRGFPDDQPVNRIMLYQRAKTLTELALAYLRNKQFKLSKDHRSGAMKVIEQLKELKYRVQDCKQLEERLKDIYHE